MIVTESLVQVTYVAGPPVEIQVRLFIDNDTPPCMVISPNDTHILIMIALIIDLTLNYFVELCIGHSSIPEDNCSIQHILAQV